MYKHRFIQILFAVTLVVCLSAVVTTVASAQEETPPQTPTTEGTTEDPQESTADTTTTEGDNPETPPPTEPDPALLQQLPDDTTIVALNEDGEPEPLVTQAAANAVATGDPIWCPAGQAPTPDANGCTQEFDSFDELLTFLKANEGDAAYQQAGTIYVGTGPYAGGETDIDFNTYDFVNINNYDLSLQGGWDPISGQVISDGSSDFAIPVIIGKDTNPWNGSVKVSNININGVDDQAALTIYATGDVTVSDGEFTNNEVGLDLNAGGAVLVEDVQADENTVGGADIVAAGDVSIEGSTFNGNGSITSSRQVYGYGVRIESGSEVTLADVVADDNYRSGADIKATADVTVSNSSFSGNKAYTNSYCGGYTAYGYGLHVLTDGSIYLNNVTADENNLYGANLDADGNVEVTTGSFSQNAFSQSTKVKVGYGLQIVSKGYVLLDGIQANNNSLFGADITSVGNTTIANSSFSNNHAVICTYAECNSCTPYGYGLRVVVSQGYIGLYNVTANGNYLYGAYLEAADYVAVSTSTFSQNAYNQSGVVKGYGLDIVAGGYASLYQVVANSNNLFGARIQSNQDIAVYKSTFSDNQASTYSYCGGTKAYGFGLQATSKTFISLRNVTADGNYLYGANLVADGNVAILNSEFNDNVFDLSNKVKVGYGLQIRSGGQVALNYVQTNGNSMFGTDVQAAGNFSVNNSSFSDNQAVICGSYECSDNCAPYGYGLRAVVGGTININNATANGNYLYGAYLETPDYISVSDSTFNQNAYDQSGQAKSGYGLLAKSGTYLSLYGVQANDNNFYGADLRAQLDIAVTSSDFSGNQGYTYSSCSGYTAKGYGLNAVTKGGIYLYDVTANDNYLYGANLVADGEVVVDTSTFDLNVFDPSTKIKVGYGLSIKSGGEVWLFFVEANGNSLFGTDIVAVGDVWVYDSTFSDNKLVVCSGSRECSGGGSSCTTYGYGIKVVTDGNAYFENVTANGNGLYGASVTADLNIDVLNGTFSNNLTAYGLSANAGGKIALTSVTASSNKTNGATLVNTTGTTVVTDSSFITNGAYGISITTSSDVTLANVATVDNGSTGAYVKGNCCINVYVIDGAYTDNGGYGLKIVKGKLFESGAPVYAGNASGAKSVDGCVASNPPSNGGCNKPCGHHHHQHSSHNHHHC